MEIPQQASNVWADIISGVKVVPFESITVRTVLGFAQLEYKRNPSTLKLLASSFYLLFEKNRALPSVQKDLEKLLSEVN
ncbi:MAG: hypothetical protein WCO69_00565 [Candidatus Omnitrophota bacterium]